MSTSATSTSSSKDYNMDNPVTNINGLTSQQIADAITKYANETDMTRLTVLKVWVSENGLEFETEYREEVSALEIKEYNI